LKQVESGEAGEFAHERRAAMDVGHGTATIYQTTYKLAGGECA
jgi:hypothetical protein